jgi:hypothetical protein
MAMNFIFISMMMIFIRPDLGETTLGFISHCTLHNYNVEFRVGIFFCLNL